MYRINRQLSWAPKNAVTALIVLATSAPLAGCGNLTSGGFTGEATVTVSGDAMDGAAPQHTAVLSPRGPAAAQDDVPEGEIEASFFLFLETASGTSASLSEDQIKIRLDVQGRREVDAVNRTILPTGQYSQMRIVFTDIEVEIESGLIINGVPVVGPIEVELEDISLTVTRQLNLNVGVGESVFFLIDLNANTWLQAVDPVLGVVMEDVFANAVSVEVR